RGQEFRRHAALHEQIREDIAEHHDRGADPRLEMQPLHQSPEPACTGAGLADLCSATNFFRFERKAIYSRASLVRRRRSPPSKIAFRTMRQTTRGRKKYSP